MKNTKQLAKMLQKAKPSRNTTYLAYSKGKQKTITDHKDTNSPNRTSEQRKNKKSLSKQKHKLSNYRLNTEYTVSKGKQSRGKTPKHWLISDRKNQNNDTTKINKKDEKGEVFRLRQSNTPKMDNTQLTDQQYYSSKPTAKPRYKSFNKQNGKSYGNIQQELKQLLEQQNKNYLKQSRVKTEYDNSPGRHDYFKKEDDRRESQVKKQEFEEYFCQKDLTQQEFKNFGDRFPENFEKLGLLGRGGFSLVWLGVHRKSKRKMAVKQILTKNPHQTHLKQIWFAGYYFNSGGQPREQFADHPGINNLCRLLYYDIKSEDTWLFYELCEDSLGNSLYELKGQTVNGERKYKIVYKWLYQTFREDVKELERLIIQISKGLLLINSHNIVHSDLKTENILLKFTKKEGQGKTIKNVKIIDFGSSFLFTNLKQFSMATPQYMPPELLNYILFQNELEFDEILLTKIEKYKNAWVIDVWSLGCVILEIVCGIPLWMSLKTKIEHQGDTIQVSGLFAVKGRLFPKIISKQIEAVKKLDYCLDNYNYSGIKVSKRIRYLLKRMLSLDPEHRISPRDILNHFNLGYQPDRIPFY